MIVVVAGLVRCGLSVTMQMLDAGGFPCKGTFPDYEPFPIGRIPWGQCNGSAVKLVDAHHHFPRTLHPLRVIRLHRDLVQQARSHNKWTKHFFNAQISEKVMVASLKRDNQIIDKWARYQDTHDVWFEEIVGSPARYAERLREIVGVDLDVKKMASVVRNRTADCYPTLLELEMVGKNG